MKGKLKKITTIVITAIIFFTMGVALPIVVKGENGDANAAQVLAGKTFTSSLVSVATSGEMKNLSGKTFATNNPGVSTIDVDDGYYTEIQVDASAVYQAGVTAGSSNIPEISDFEVVKYPGSSNTVPITIPKVEGQIVKYSATTDNDNTSAKRFQFEPISSTEYFYLIKSSYNNDGANTPLTTSNVTIPDGATIEQIGNSYGGLTSKGYSSLVFFKVSNIPEGGYIEVPSTSGTTGIGVIEIAYQ